MKRWERKSTERSVTTEEIWFMKRDVVYDLKDRMKMKIIEAQINNNAGIMVNAWMKIIWWI